jgi:2,4-dienoyl-CoA reductase-like NADH-dependent reductase (Old Yellow Enzyme family)
MFAKPKQLSLDEIQRIERAFVSAAKTAKETGFTGVQIHAAHGYLISQFLSPRSNIRSDAYGGSLDNRMRFLLETYRQVRAAVGATFPVSVKLNSADFLHGGFSFDDAAVVARTLSEEGVDLLEISGGTYEKPVMMRSPSQRTTEREAHFLEFVRAVRPRVMSPVMLTGGLRTPAVMAHLVQEGSVDVIGLGRPVALEPDLPAQILRGRLAPSALPQRNAALGGLLGAVVDSSWYQRQLQRMGAGQPPRAAMGVSEGLWATLRQYVSPAA